MKLTGVVKNGRPTFAERDLLIAGREIGEGKPCEAEITPPKKTRTPRANSRYWTVLLPLVRHSINENRMHQGLPPIPGDKQTMEEIHAQMVRRMVGVDDTVIGPIRKPTHTMSTREFWLYTEKVTLWLREQGWEIDGEEEPAERQDSAA
jgi:hypothetical protein